MFNEETKISAWVADMYDMDETNTEDVEFALALLGQKPQKVLEIACGSGRYLVPMAKAGHSVMGLDFDEIMLKKLEKRAQGLEQIHWRKADVIHSQWGEGYDTVLLAANFLLNIVSEMDYEKAQELLIQKAAIALKTGGHLLIDYGYTQFPEQWFDRTDDHVIWQGKDSSGNWGTMLLRNSTYNKETGMIHFIRRFEIKLASGETIIQEIPSKKHYVVPEKIHKWLQQSGFIVEKEYGSYHGDPISEFTNRAIIWARKE